MKTLLTLTFLLYMNITVAQTEKYYVTFVKGEVNNKKTNKQVKVGDVLLTTDALTFKDKLGKVSCISPGKGRFDISAQNTKASSSGELLAVLKSNLIPAQKTYQLSSRSLLFEGYDPITYFQSRETGNRILLFENESLPIIPSYKLDNEHFFFLQYKVNGETVIKKLDQGKAALPFHKNLFKEGVPQQVMICYQKQLAGKATSSALAEFIPVFANKANLLNEIAVIKKNIGNNNKTLKEAVTAHIFDNYGKISQSQIEDLLTYSN